MTFWGMAFCGKAKRLAYTQPAKAGLLDPLHLAAKFLDRQDVTYVAGFGLAELAARQLEFVIHQERDARTSHYGKDYSKCSSRSQ